MGWADGAGLRVATDDCDFFGRRARVVVDVGCKERRESGCDARPPRIAFGRATLFCSASCSSASAAVSNDLRFRLPRLSYQSAKYFVPRWYIWTPQDTRISRFIGQFP